MRKLNIPGSDLKVSYLVDHPSRFQNVHYLRVASEANAIHAAAGGKNVVCIGASFIGS